MDIIKWKWGLIILLVLVMGCASLKTTITNPQGETWTIISKKDALVKFKTESMEGEIDNRGKLNLVESTIGALLMKTNINLKNRGRD